MRTITKVLVFKITLFNNICHFLNCDRLVSVQIDPMLPWSNMPRSNLVCVKYCANFLSVLSVFARQSNIGSVRLAFSPRMHYMLITTLKC